MLRRVFHAFLGMPDIEVMFTKHVMKLGKFSKITDEINILNFLNIEYKWIIIL